MNYSIVFILIITIASFFPYIRLLWYPNRDDVWHTLSEDLNGKFIKDRGKFRDKNCRVEIQHGEWKIILDGYFILTSTIGDGSEVTRVRAAFISNDGFKFEIFKKSIFSRIGKFFSIKQSQIGFPKFDNNFIIKGNDEKKIKQVFKRSKIRNLIFSLPIDFHLKIVKWLNTYLPENVYELYFETTNLIFPRDIKQLKILINLFAEILDQLCHIGSVSENDPKVDLI